MNVLNPATRHSALFGLVVATVFLAQTGDLFGQEETTEQGEAKQDDKSHPEKIVEIELVDDEIIKGRLCLPESENAAPVDSLIVFVHGTGPGTYLTKRQRGGKDFHYFDLFAKQLNDRGVAFFSYNKRGVTNSDKAPWFDEVDREKFRKVVPDVETQDLATIVDFLKTNERLTDANVALLGWSEGTVIAAMVAEKHPEKIDALLLAGYAHENMFDIIKQQFSGHPSMMNLNPVFDEDGDGKISRDEYESEDETVARYRKRVMKGAAFKFLDATENGHLEAEDFAIRSKPLHSLLLYNLSTGNEDWIWNNYFRISVPWLQQHFSLEPNKTRLTRVDLPIYIFHGTDDPNVEVAGVHDLAKRFKALAKTNLETFVFEGHDHDLNYSPWATKDDMSEGMSKIFEVASGIGKSRQKTGQK